MSRPLEDNEITRVLRDGLQAQPVPQPGLEFDDRVLAALRDRRPWWQLLWFSARPIVSTAACSMVVMLAILHWSLQPSTPALRAHPADSPALPTAESGITMAALDKALDRPDLQFGTFTLLLEQYKPRADGEARPSHLTPGRPPEPPRRDGLAPHRDAILA